MLILSLLKFTCCKESWSLAPRAGVEEGETGIHKNYPAAESSHPSFEDGEVGT